MSGDVPLTQQQVSEAGARVDKESYPHEVLVAFDQLCNVASWKLLGSKGLPDETISAHVRRLSDDPHYKHAFLAHILNHALDFIQKNHGALAEAGDLERAKNVQKTEDQALGTEQNE